MLQYYSSSYNNRSFQNLQQMTISRLKVLIAPDKFRPKLSAQQVCQIITSEISTKYITKSIPLADGGQGSLESIAECLKTQKIHLTVNDPLLRQIRAYYLLQKQSRTAYIEMAKASGLSLLKKQQRNPLNTSTYGTGQLIKNAIEQGCKRIVLMIGGSATNQVGIGAACALGYRFLDQNSNDLEPIGQNLQKIQKIIKPEFKLLKEVKAQVWTDVKNPLVGKQGATYFFGPQKGANKQDLQKLQRGIINLNNQFIKYFSINLGNVPGGGAAGGLGAGAIAFLNAKIMNGFERITEIVKLRQQIRSSDIVVTGEGKVDSQTLGGKLVSGVVNLAKQYQKPVTIFCGKSEIDQKLFGNNVKIIPNQTLNLTDQYSIDHAQELLRKNVRQSFKI